MKTSCDVIQDLLHLYKNHKTSEASNQLIMEHVAQCEQCRRYFSLLLSSFSEDHLQQPLNQEHTSNDTKNMLHDLNYENLPKTNIPLEGQDLEDHHDDEGDIRKMSSSYLMNTEEEGEKQKNKTSDTFNEEGSDHTDSEHDQPVKAGQENQKEDDMKQRLIQGLLQVLFYGGAAFVIGSAFVIGEEDRFFAFTLIYPFFSFVFGFSGYFFLKRWWNIPIVIFIVGCLLAIIWFSLQPVQTAFYYMILSVIGTFMGWLSKKIVHLAKEVRSE